MKPLLTTITPYWARAEQFPRWIKAITASTMPEVRHFVYMVGMPTQNMLAHLLSKGMNMVVSPNITFIPGDQSHIGDIGYFHNLGAADCDTEWMMKLDVDCLPNNEFFRNLLPVLEKTQPKEWFNAGMFMVPETASRAHLSLSSLPLTANKYGVLVRLLGGKDGRSEVRPVGTQFICRTSDYLEGGGCLKTFKGWGWEDYQQIYMLERNQLGRDPLPGPVSLNNVTVRCREEISRRKTVELVNRNPYLALIHHWHEPAPKNNLETVRNKMVLYDYITKQKRIDQTK